MTQQDSMGALVDEMLADAGHAGDGHLRGALLSLGALASLPAPVPSGQLAVLLAEPAAEADEVTRRRRRFRNLHRPTALGLALVAGMGLGVGGVAASSSGAGPGAGASVQQLLEGWAPSWSLPVRPPAADRSLVPAAAAAAGSREPHDSATEPDIAGPGSRETRPVQGTAPGPGPAVETPPPSSRAAEGETAGGEGNGLGTGSRKGNLEASGDMASGSAGAGEPGPVSPSATSGKAATRKDAATGQQDGKGAGPAKGADAAGAGMTSAEQGVLPAVQYVTDAAGGGVRDTGNASSAGAAWLRKFTR